MDIKQYDIVKYNGRTQRVMLICNGSMCLTEDDWQSPSSVELVESFKNPDFQIGDEVFINPPMGMYDSEFINRVASVIVREPKSYTSEELVGRLYPVIERHSRKKMFSLVKLYPLIITDGTMQAFCRRGHKELRQFRKARIHISRGPYPWIHYSIDDLEAILNVLVDKKVISINPIYNNDYDIV